ncbi:MAG: response regulator [Chloroflexi bacterium]|nr:response regulator [Chloroflexota bacterium]
MATESYVLVVDDDPAIRGLVADALREEGYSVDLAAHGREALEAMRARRPATVVLDLMMPIMDGFSFLEACQNEQLCDNVPVVVMSAMQDALVRIQAAPIQAYLAKPFDLNDLIRTVALHARRNGGTAANGHVTG